MMEEILEYRQALLSAMLEVVQELVRTVAAIPTRAWHTPCGQEAHTPHFTLARLRQLEANLFASNLQRIGAGDGPILPLFDENDWVKNYQPGEAAKDILNEFAYMRQQEVTWLRDLPAASWGFTGRHPHWGVRTLQWWVEQQLDTSRQHWVELTCSLVDEIEE